MKTLTLTVIKLDEVLSWYVEVCDWLQCDWLQCNRYTLSAAIWLVESDRLTSISLKTFLVIGIVYRFFINTCGLLHNTYVYRL